MARIIRIIIALTTLVLFLTPAACGQDEQSQKDWTGKLADGTRITTKDLQKIFSDHKQWLESGNSDKITDLSDADLGHGDLSRSILE